MKRRVFFLFACLIGFALVIRWLFASPNLPAFKPTDLYIDPQPVEIAGYDGSVMEVFISLDGNYLFFNNSSAADGPDSKDEGDLKEMFFAERAGPISFRFLGKVPGVNVPMRDGFNAAPSIDKDGRYYFTSSRQYEQDVKSNNDYRTIFFGKINGREVTDVSAIEGNINPREMLGLLNMDVGISPDGKTLYVSRVYISPRVRLMGGPPEDMHLLIAQRQGDKFMLDPRSAEIMKNVNMSDCVYAPAVTDDGLEIYYNSGPRIVVATRNSINEPFGEPRIIEAISGFAEAPSLSLDKREMFIHRKVGKTFKPYRLVRNPNPTK